jgi:hypothetical protein
MWPRCCRPAYRMACGLVLGQRHRGAAGVVLIPNF